MADPEVYPEVAVTGSPVVVFAYKTDRCDELDIPDAALRAYRRADGMIVGFSTHFPNRRLVGSSISDLKRDCRVVYQGRHDPDPAAFDDRTWIAATWTEDGTTVSALGHNEYQADKFPGRCRFKDYRSCWYNSIVPLSSTDAGYSFSRMDRQHLDLIAAAPFPSDVGQGEPRGYMNPTNIIFDGRYYYALVYQTGIPGVPPGECLMRTSKPEESANWTIYDGTDFVPFGKSPYEHGTQHPPCQTIHGLNGEIGSIGRLANSDLFVAFTIASHASIPEGGAVDVAFSKDLLSWSGRKPILNVRPGWVKGPAKGWRYHYVSVVDDRDPGRNFDQIGTAASLFIVRLSCVDGETMVRDLIRMPISLRPASR
nr:hypothetical protein [uncultured Rhodopila sp.]